MFVGRGYRHPFPVGAALAAIASAANFLAAPVGIIYCQVPEIAYS